MGTWSRCIARSLAATAVKGWVSAPSGNTFNISGITKARISHGQIVEAWSCFDFLSLYGQVGLVQLPGAARMFIQVLRSLLQQQPGIWVRIPQGHKFGMVVRPVDSFQDLGGRTRRCWRSTHPRS